MSLTYLDNTEYMIFLCSSSMIDTALCRVFSSEKLSVNQWPILHRWFPCAMLAHIDQDDMNHFPVQSFLWTVGQHCAYKNSVHCCLRVSRQCQIGKNTVNIVLIFLWQHCTSKNPRQCSHWGSRQQFTGKNPAQCCLSSLGTTLHR